MSTTRINAACSRRLIGHIILAEPVEGTKADAWLHYHTLVACPWLVNTLPRSEQSVVRLKLRLPACCPDRRKSWQRSALSVSRTSSFVVEQKENNMPLTLAQSVVGATGSGKSTASPHFFLLSLERGCKALTANATR